VRRLSACILILMILAAAKCYSQDYLYSISVFGSFTTTSKLFHHPNDADELVRSQFLPLNSIFSTGIDIRRSIEPLRIRLGLSIEYISKTEILSLPSSTNTQIPVKDGYTAVPVEISGFFTIPIGTEVLQMYMGGGCGIYTGTRNYTYGGARSVTVDRKVNIGIHVLSGVEYALAGRFSLRGELKFRDVQFETVNKFTSEMTMYDGSFLTLDQEGLASHIHIDGMTLNIGVAYHF